ncbi:hypothetical protein DFH27DRAFT_2385 [Peziza echinospora]|nr:hypothetical protein DFH27DRAFT_2385 [Peziza echinospora]
MKYIFLGRTYFFLFGFPITTVVSCTTGVVQVCIERKAQGNACLHYIMHRFLFPCPFVAFLFRSCYSLAGLCLDFFFVFVFLHGSSYLHLLDFVCLFLLFLLSIISRLFISFPSP